MPKYLSDAQILALFTPARGGPVCGNCYIRAAVCIHEIEPKSARPKTWKEASNRIPLCAACHHWVHNIAAPGKAAPTLRRNRAKTLRLLRKALDRRRKEV